MAEGGKPITYVIDRFEGEFAVCEDTGTREIVNIKRKKLPLGAKAGMVILKNTKAGEADDGEASGEAEIYTIDLLKTAERDTRIKSLFERLKK